MKLTFGPSVFVFALLAVPGFAAKAGAPAAVGPSAGEILQRCQQAYSSLKTYQGTARSHTTSTFSGHPAQFSAFTEISFVRPNMLRLHGALMTGGNYDLISNPQGTWTSSTVSHGDWTHEADLNAGLSKFIATAQQSGYLLPILLTSPHANQVFRSSQGGPTLQGVEKVDGKPSYKISVPHERGVKIFWVDKQSYLLTQVSVIFTESAKIKGSGTSTLSQMLEAGRKGRLEIKQSQEKVQVNKPIAVGTFAKPASAK